MNPHGLKDLYATAFYRNSLNATGGLCTLQSCIAAGPITSAHRLIEGCEAGSTTKAGLTACQTARCRDDGPEALLLYSECSCFTLGLEAHVVKEAGLAPHSPTE